jgi:hypothetical protein
MDMEASCPAGRAIHWEELNVSKIQHALKGAALSVAIALFALGLFCGLQPPPVQAGGQPPGQCQPTDMNVNGPPCFDKAGAQCVTGGAQSSCAPSPNNTQCTCPVP